MFYMVGVLTKKKSLTLYTVCDKGLQIPVRYICYSETLKNDQFIVDIRFIPKRFIYLYSL